ncbi:MAG: N-acyl homoserine lactonase family protein [Hyphomicrobiales bacterium]|nr:N-acyl homoserine lactonase family protein [Hyphomicrobiales bacterium]
MTKVHLLQTGTVALGGAQLAARGQGVARLWNGLFGAGWSDFLPIYAYLIEHAEGLILVDTGETADVMQHGYFPHWHPYYLFSVKFDLKPHDEIGPQLRAAGFDPANVKTVVQTHLHTDHAGGLRYFPHAKILVTTREYQAARGAAGRIAGYPNNRWPDWFAPQLVDLPAQSDDLLAGSLPLTRDGAVRLIATPGHTLGHMSVSVDLGEKIVLLAGDVSYLQQTLLDLQPDGLGADPAAETQTHRRIQMLARKRPLVYLNGHDPDCARRLAALEPLL